MRHGMLRQLGSPLVLAPKILVPPESIPVPSSVGGAELRHPDLNSEDPAADLNTHRETDSGHGSGSGSSRHYRESLSVPLRKITVVMGAVRGKKIMQFSRPIAMAMIK
ncbi:hypothetical protein LWI29_019620 [Acer saccharum]|uniref:Uncharacterized protein n=1 Tax=Acer saccharum TaxID=4024 RepID=A0AA39VVP4_ACESA|nr:hypothetical protein LWI29_019620 [Acer saccharum]